MSLNTVQNITLDFTVPRIKNVRCIENDNDSRIINILVTNNGETYPLDPDIMIARYKIHKPDHTYIYNEVPIKDDGTITIILPDQAMVVPGISRSELQISDSSTGKILSTMPFHIIVEKSVVSNRDIESSNESDVINKIINHSDDYNNPHKTTKEQVGLGNVDNTSDIDKPVSTAQQKALDEKVDKTAIATSSVPGLIKSGTDITVDAEGNVSVNDNSHEHTASNISDLTGFTQNLISVHNTLNTAHNDIRDLISELATRLNALADSDDTTLDQLSEIVSYIKSNRSLIENVTTNKINVSDIIDHLSSDAANKPLSAKQGKVLKDLIDALTTAVSDKVDKVSGKGMSTNDYTTAEKNKLACIAAGAEVNVQSDWNVTDTDSDAYIKNKPTIPTKTSQLENDSGFTDSYTHPDIAADAEPNGLYKISTDKNGHVIEVVNVTKSDITSLGIPAQDTNTWRGIQDNLTSTSATDSLSAKQGKVLKELVDNKAASSHTHDDRYFTESEITTALNGKAASSHNHSSFTTGLTLSGDLLIPNNYCLRGKDAAGTATKIAHINASNNFHIGDNSATVTHGYLNIGGTLFNFNTAYFAPNADNTNTLGGSSKRWRTVYAKTGTINTSDRNKKHEIHDLIEVYEKLFLKLKPKSFIFNDGDRVHIGAIAQDVEDIMNELGLKPEEIAGFCKDIRYEYDINPEDGTEIEESKRPKLDEDGNILYDYSLRYQEFIFLTIHMVQKLFKRTDAIKNEYKLLCDKNGQLEEEINGLKKENDELREELNLIKNQIAFISQNQEIFAP